MTLSALCHQVYGGCSCVRRVNGQVGAWMPYDERVWESTASASEDELRAKLKTIVPVERREHGGNTYATLGIEAEKARAHARRGSGKMKLMGAR